MTFCIPVSVSSPKLWALSFYHGTLTKDSFLGCNEGDENATGSSLGILQLLKFDHRHLVPILGKQSGRDVDKSFLCSKEGFPWSRVDTSSTQDCDFELLPGCALYIQVKCRSSDGLINAGDHVVAICEVTRVGVWEQTDGEELNDGKVRWLDDTIPLGAIDESNALYSGRLRKEGIL